MTVLIRGSVHGVGSAQAAVFVQDGRIGGVGTGEPPQPADLELLARPGELIAPGFIDLQVNGFGSHDAAAGPDAPSALSRLPPGYGVTAVLPPPISGPRDDAAAFPRTTRRAPLT